MNDIIKKPYKITLWEDKNVYIIEEWENSDKTGESRVYKTHILPDSEVPEYTKSYEIQNQFLEEVCVATIGSNTMDTPIRAFNPVLTEELNGSKTLTFQIYMKYWDDDEEDFKKNPFQNLIVNERKVKLKYGDEEDPWKDFVIKQVSEDSENEAINVTCKDLFINELGKTGYEVELDTELSNNMGTVTELADRILENTDWQERNSEHLFQWHKEALFDTTSLSGLSNIKELNWNKEGNKGERVYYLSDEPEIETPIYVFYSCVAEKESKVQFLFNVVMEDEKPKQDEYGFINGHYGEADVSSFYNQFYSNGENEIPIMNGEKISTYFGNKLVKKQKSKYFPEIGETCFLYKKTNDGKEYWCYTEAEYISSDTIQNLLSNSGNFTPNSTTGGWNIVPNSGVEEDTTTNMNIDNTSIEEKDGTNRQRGILRVALKGGH